MARRVSTEQDLIGIIESLRLDKQCALDVLARQNADIDKIRKEAEQRAERYVLILKVEVAGLRREREKIVENAMMMRQNLEAVIRNQAIVEMELRQQIQKLETEVKHAKSSGTARLLARSGELDNKLKEAESVFVAQEKEITRLRERLFSDHNLDSPKRTGPRIGAVRSVWFPKDRKGITADEVFRRNDPAVEEAVILCEDTETQELVRTAVQA